MKKIEFLEDFFSSYAKIALFIPLAILIIGLFLRLAENKTIKQDLVLISPTATIKKSITPTPSKIKIDLEGPFICQINTSEASISAFIEKQKVFAQLQEKEAVKNYLLSGDCLYSWEEKKYTGEKICGLGQYLPLLNNLSSFNFDLVNQLAGNQIPLKEFSINQLFSQCRNEEIINKEIFKLPSLVIFKNL
jgi:hypothetical protein